MSLDIVFPLTLFFAYLLLYTSHYRGYFFIKEGHVSSFETYRYINNFFYLLPIMFLPLRSKLVKPIKFIVCIALAFSLYNTYSLRFKMSETEYQERFKVAKTVSTYKQIPLTVYLSARIFFYTRIYAVITLMYAIFAFMISWIKIIKLIIIYCCRI